MKYNIGDVVSIKLLVHTDDYSGVGAELTGPAFKTKRGPYKQYATYQGLVMGYHKMSNGVWKYSVRMWNKNNDYYQLFGHFWCVEKTYSKEDKTLDQKTFQQMFPSKKFSKNPNVIDNFVFENITKAKKYYDDYCNPDIKVIDKKIGTWDTDLYKQITEPEVTEIKTKKTTIKKVVKKSTKQT